MIRRHVAIAFTLLCTASLSLAGCESDDPAETSPATGSAGTTGASGSSGAAGSGGGSGGGAGAGGASGGAAGAGGTAIACTVIKGGDGSKNDASCKPLATDFDSTNAAGDGWAACVSDSGVFTPFDTNVSSNARTLAIDKIGALLGFDGKKTPSPQDFIDALAEYSVAEGLGSRVQRREDEHYPAAPMACNKLAPADQAMYPDRCAGPVKIQPIVDAAFKDGIAGKEPRLNAARLEAAFMWFSYISTHKEVRSCEEAVGDCDSATGYFNGAQTRNEQHGLGKLVKQESTQAYDRVWEGLLASRCWRDLDPTTPTTKPDLMKQAQAQLDRALLRGYALIVRSRVLQRQCDTAWTGVQIMGPVLLREAKVRDAAKAAVLEAEFAKTPDQVDETALVGALDAIFNCP